MIDMEFLLNATFTFLTRSLQGGLHGYRVSARKGVLCSARPHFASLCLALYPDSRQLRATQLPRSG